MIICSCQLRRMQSWSSPCSCLPQLAFNLFTLVDTWEWWLLMLFFSVSAAVRKLLSAVTFAIVRDLLGNLGLFAPWFLSSGLEICSRPAIGSRRVWMSLNPDPYTHMYYFFYQDSTLLWTGPFYVRDLAGRVSVRFGYICFTTNLYLLLYKVSEWFWVGSRLGQDPIRYHVWIRFIEYNTDSFGYWI